MNIKKKELRELSELIRQGNAGVNENGQIVIHINTPGGEIGSNTNGPVKIKPHRYGKQPL